MSDRLTVLLQQIEAQTVELMWMWQELQQEQQKEIAMAHKFNTEGMNTSVPGVADRIVETHSHVTKHANVKERLEIAMDHLEEDLRASGLTADQTKLVDTFRDNRAAWVTMVVDGK